MGEKALKHDRRLRRQFRALARFAPAAERTIDRLTDRRARLLRIPAAGLFLVGGIFSFLPVLGLWMLPLGLLLLAVDVPALRPRVNAAMIRGRRRVALWRRWWSGSR